MLNASTSALQSTLGCARYLKMPTADIPGIQAVASRYQKNLNKIAKALKAGDAKRAKHWTGKVLRSDDSRICALVRTATPNPDVPPLTLDAIISVAWTLNPFKPIPGRPVIQVKQKSEGGHRITVAFNWHRKALQRICSDLLDIHFPYPDFDFQKPGAGGPSAAIQHLKQLIDQGYDYVVVIDLKNFFGSANKKKVEDLLPFAPAVTQNVLTIRDAEKVKVALPNEDCMDSPPNAPSIVEADEAARQGVPQGSSTSSIIMYRGVLGPLLGALSFADRIVLFGDDIAIPVKDKLEGEAVLKALEAALASTPVGLLHIGRHDIRRVSSGVDFLSHRIIRKPAKSGGHLHVRPSPKAYKRFYARAEAKYSKACGGKAGYLRVMLYMKQWLRSFPLWKPNALSKLYVFLELQAFPWFSPVKSTGQGTGTKPGIHRQNGLSFKSQKS